MDTQKRSVNMNNVGRKILGKGKAGRTLEFETTQKVRRDGFFLPYGPCLTETDPSTVLAEWYL